MYSLTIKNQIIEMVGMQDSFGESGAPEELWEKYGMGTEAIKQAIHKVIKRKVK